MTNTVPLEALEKEDDRTERFGLAAKFEEFLGQFQDEGERQEMKKILTRIIQTSNHGYWNADDNMFHLNEGYRMEYDEDKDLDKVRDKLKALIV